MLAATVSSRLIAAPAGMLLGRAGSSGRFRVVWEAFRNTSALVVFPAAPAVSVCQRTVHSHSHSHSIEIQRIPPLAQSIASLTNACRDVVLGRCRDSPPPMGCMARASPLRAVVRGATTVVARLVNSVMPNFARDQVRRMSSTLKKRRAKMNKHKLRKRRKKDRRKNK